MNTVADQQSSQRQHWYWICQSGGWGIVFFAQLMEARLNNWQWNRALLEMAISCSILFLATHLLRHHIHTHHWASLKIKPLTRRVIASAATLSIIFVILLVPLEIFLYNDFRLIETLSGALLAFNIAITLLIWQGLYFGIVLLRHRQKAGAEEARLRAALRTAELSLLKSQLNPHFLFNALNSVRALIGDSPSRAQDAITQLARTLRYSLNSARDELVTLRNEMEIVDDYLAIESLRLAERLKIEKHIASDSLQARIPIMLLQILVENAVKHGISQLQSGGTLSISASLDKAMLMIEVENPRPEMSVAATGSDHIGLANANDRLRLMFGPQAKLHLDLSDAQRAVASVQIPQQTVMQ